MTNPGPPDILRLAKYFHFHTDRKGTAMFTIKFIIEGGDPVVISANAGEKLLDVARKANVAIDAPCSGNGVCGTCRVRLASG